MAKRTARHTTNCLMALCVICLIMCSPLSANSQNWAYFHPEAVRSISCEASTTTLSESGGQAHDVFAATASAKRENMQDWQFTLGYFPPTDKGADQAIDACKRWRREASKRLKQVKREPQK